jgi:N-glycosylase/DNA lyase
MGERDRFGRYFIDHENQTIMVDTTDYYDNSSYYKVIFDPKADDFEKLVRLLSNVYENGRSDKLGEIKRVLNIK